VVVAADKALVDTAVVAADSSSDRIGKLGLRKLGLLHIQSVLVAHKLLLLLLLVAAVHHSHPAVEANPEADMAEPMAYLPLHMYATPFKPFF